MKSFTKNYEKKFYKRGPAAISIGIQKKTPDQHVETNAM